MASIYTTDGNELTVGLQGCNLCDEAIQAAQRFADDLDTDVELHDDDGRWLVHPRTYSNVNMHDVRVHREPADFLGEVNSEVQE
jgi:hypothetical protein